jgi:integrase
MNAQVVAPAHATLGRIYLLVHVICGLPRLRIVCINWYPSKVTVSEFLDRWEKDWAANNVSPKTRERFAQLIAHQVQPHLGNMLMQKLRVVHLNELYGKLLRDGRVGGGQLSAKTVGHVHRCLRRAFGHAAQWGLITQNPAALVHPPRVQQVEIEILRENEVEVMLTSLRERNALLCTIAIVALGSGLRRGELCALRWSNVDLDSRTLRVEQSLEQTRAGLRFKAPKIKHGLRTMTLPPSVISELRAHWRAQNEQRLALGIGRSTPQDLVFPGVGPSATYAQHTQPRMVAHDRCYWRPANKPACPAAHPRIKPDRGGS